MKIEVKMTQYSHGSGCGCKISPAVLTQILSATETMPVDPNLIVGNDNFDDAAVYQIDDRKSIISTTDFFMPIVDDPFDFGAIAAVNAISDIYAMGGKPLMAISILGWPVDKLPAEVATQVVDGGKDACRRAGIPLAGGHSIDTPEPIFGLAVTGIVDNDKIRRNNGAEPGCELFLTKPLGIGILSTAEKKGILTPEDRKLNTGLMLRLNDFGAKLSDIPGVKSITDVTGFGLLGHLKEMCEGSGVSAEIEFSKVPIIPSLPKYVEAKAYAGGLIRNYESYGHLVTPAPLPELQKAALCDPQTSGGLLIAVSPDSIDPFLKRARMNGLELNSFGRIVEKREKLITVTD
jgi:selenide,water dikinase